MRSPLDTDHDALILLANVADEDAFHQALGSAVRMAATHRRLADQLGEHNLAGAHRREARDMEAAAARLRELGQRAGHIAAAADEQREGGAG